MATIAMPPSASALPAKAAAAAKNGLSSGLTTDEAHRRLEKFGPNAMPDTALHPLRMAIEKFWAPVPWMLEAAIVLELVLGKYVEAAIIAALLWYSMPHSGCSRRAAPRRPSLLSSRGSL